MISSRCCLFRPRSGWTLAVAACLLAGTTFPGTMAGAWPQETRSSTGATSDALDTQADSGVVGMNESVFNERYNLTASTLIQLDVPMDPGQPFSVPIPLDGQIVTLSLSPHSARAPSYEVRVYGADGGFTIAEPAPLRTMAGHLEDIDGSRAAASLYDEGLEAMILMPDGQRWNIQPLSAQFPTLSRRDHLLYRGEDMIPSGGTCGGPMDTEPTEGGAPEGGGCGAGICVAELACDADVEYYQDYGSNVTNVQNRINSVTNTMNIQYQNQVGIVHLITTILVRTAEPDPYSSTAPSTLLNQFRNEWLNNQSSIPRDVAELFTGKNLDGTVIGIAFTIGGICTSSAYCLVQSDCCSPNFQCATDLSAHELGHLWGAVHCSSSCSSTMNAGLTCVNTFLNSSPSSVASIVAHRDSRTCLSPLGAPPPFFDDFPSTAFDTSKWIQVTNGLINTLASGEPSAPNAANLDTGADVIATNQILLGSGFQNGTISYYTERVGVEAGKTLRVDYLDSANAWIEINSIPGGANQTAFQFWTHDMNTLPGAGAYHDGFRLRFRALGADGTDDWYIDNVSVSAVADTNGPTPNPMTFFIAPTPFSGFQTISINMSATTASDPSTPIQYKFDESTGNPGGSSSTWQASTSFIDGGLTPNTLYTYTTRARDGILNENTPSAPASTATWIQEPTGLTAGTITSNSIVLNATGTFTNLGVGQSGIFFESLTPGGNGGISEWVQATTDTATGLLPNTMYTFRVKSRNQLGVEFSDASPVTATFQTLPGAGGCTLLGDLDDNGTVNGLDIGGFVRVKLGTPAPGDIVDCANYGSGTINGDVSLFVTDLLN